MPCQPAADISIEMDVQKEAWGNKKVRKTKQKMQTSIEVNLKSYASTNA